MNRIDIVLKRIFGELPTAPVAKWAAILFSFFVLTLQISIAASQIFFTAAGILYFIHLLQARPEVHFPPVKLSLALFCILTLIAIVLATNPIAGLVVFRKFVLFLIWLLAINLVVSAEHLRRLILSFLLVSLLTSLVAIGQFIIQYRDLRAHHPAELYHLLTSTRIHGFMGHWMHFGGQQMMVFAFLIAFLLLSYDRTGTSQDAGASTEIAAASWDYRDWPVWWVVLGFVIVSIILNFTRGVWLGCFLSTVYLVYRWRPKVLLLLPVLLALGYVGAPSLIRERLHLAMHPRNEPALSIRLEMWSDAVRMIRAHPWAGVGPNNVEEEYVLYLPPGTTPELGYHNHFHNDYLQIGAERGLPCLAAWIWLMAALGWSTLKVRRRLTSQRWIADAALAAWMAFLVEGCFEFNFGTSPVIMAFLFVSSTPFIAAKFAASGKLPEESGAK